MTRGWAFFVTVAANHPDSVAHRKLKRRFSMPLVCATFNPRLERLKVRLEAELGRRLSDHEEHLIELSAVLLEEESEQDDYQSESA